MRSKRFEDHRPGVEAHFRALKAPLAGLLDVPLDLAATSDGATLAFTANVVDEFGDRPRAAIGILNVATGKVDFLRRGPWNDRTPRFSPDGRTLAFLTDEALRGVYQLALFGPGGFVLAPLVEGVIEDLWWSPDGNEILILAAGRGADLAGAQGSGSLAVDEGAGPAWAPSVEIAVPDQMWRRLWRAAVGVAREVLWVVRAKRVVLATGALEQPLVFDNNDRPGVMLCGAARQYLWRYGVAPGRRAVVATNNDSAYATVIDLRQAGVEVACVADTRSDIPDEIRSALRSLDVEVAVGAIPVDTVGFGALRGVTIGQLSQGGASVSATRKFECDTLLVSGGWNPALHLYAQAGGKLGFDVASGSLRPVNELAGTEIVGAATEPATTAIGCRASPVGKSHRQWVDLLHDVTVADLELALREHYTSVEHVKRYTTVGMSVDQGKTSTVAALDTLARLRGIHPAELGYTTQRPPFTPVTLGALAGRDTGERFAPSRLLPMDPERTMAIGHQLAFHGHGRRLTDQVREVNQINPSGVMPARIQ